jgi:DNA invertase Pin-like site-specific DNA recombinase
MAVRAGIYVRVSKAGRDLLDAGRQVPPCRAFCDERGWQVVETYIDDSRSAWKDIKRDNFERMLADVRAGRLDVLVSWQVDRLLRTVVDASAIITIAKTYGTQVANVGGTIDLGTASGRKAFYELAVEAEHESDVKSERLRLKHSELASQGKWSGGTRSFGYGLEEFIYTDNKGKHVKYRLVVNQPEAAAIKAAAGAVIDGASVTGIVKEWAAGGVTSAQGRTFRYQDVKELLVSPRIAGFRQVDGKLVQAEWDAIITREQHEELTRILGAPRSRGSNLGTARSYLLTGYLHCGVCGTRMRSHASRATREAASRQRYVCDPRDRPPGTAPHGIKRLASVVDEQVVLHLLLELPERLLEAARRAPEEWESLGRLLTARQTEEDRLDGFADFLADGTWDRPTYVRQKRRVQGRINDLDDKIDRLRASAPRRRLKGATLEELRAEWDALDLEERRVLLADHLERVVIKPVGPGRRPFDPDSIVITWRP